MPELPEVEVVKKSLQKEITNLTIKNVKIIDGNLRYKVKKEDINKIIGLKIYKIRRRSKYLLFYFNFNFIMIAHLGMTGKFFIIDKAKIKKRTSFYYQVEGGTDKHNRVIINFENKSQLIYHDVRKFGFLKFETLKNINKNFHLKSLGPEPLSNNFDIKYFKECLKRRSRKIKDLLMDQKFVSGLGNIYVNEILFEQNKAHKKSSKLSYIEIKNIIKNTKKVIKKAVLLGGSSIRNFSNSLGKKKEIFSSILRYMVKKKVNALSEAAKVS